MLRLRALLFFAVMCLNACADLDSSPPVVDIRGTEISALDVNLAIAAIKPHFAIYQRNFVPPVSCWVRIVNRNELKVICYTYYRGDLSGGWHFTVKRVKGAWCVTDVHDDIPDERLSDPNVVVT